MTGNVLSGPQGRLSRSCLRRSCRRGLDGRGRIPLWGLVLLLGRILLLSRILLLGLVLLRSGRSLRLRILLLIAANRCRRIVLPVRINSLLRLAIPWCLRIALGVTLGACRRIGHLLLSGRPRLLVGLLLRPLGTSPHLGVVVLLGSSVAAPPETKAAGTEERVQKSLSETESLQGHDHCYC